MKRVTMTILVASALIFTAACGGGETSNNGANTGGSNTPGNTVAITDIPDVYNRTCLSCHAADLSGNMKNFPNANLQNVGSRLSRDEIADIIRNGKPGTMMPAQASRLSDEQINELADWLATLK